jgi:D-sedoheptulose 7-phosphate isomerase
LKDFLAILTQHQDVVGKLSSQAEHIEAVGNILVNSLNQGGKILLCGNGGSAADCQHIAAEIVVRYEKQRKALAAIALTTDTSILTASANDFEFDSVFSRQVEALGNPVDCLIAISTSGCSKNVIHAANSAKQKALKVIAMTGQEDSELAGIADLTVKVPSTITARIQEAHILIGHWWCGLIEDHFSRDL